MKIRNKKTIIIIIIAILLIILCGGLIFTYAFTDSFKSNKYLFSKYLSENKELIELFKDKEIESYINRQNITNYSTKGTIKADIDLSINPSKEKMNEALKNCSIEFDGNVDRQHNYIYENIKAKYSDTQSLNFEVVKSNDIYAMKINEVLNRYIGIENNNLKEFAQKMGANGELLQAIPAKIDLSVIQNNNLFTDDEIKQLKDKYANLIVNNLEDSEFSKEQYENGNIYTLTISNEKLKKIVTDICSNIKDDEVIWNKFKTLLQDYLSEENLNQYIESIKQGLENIQETDISEQSSIDIKIKVYVENRKLTKTELIFSNGEENEEIKIELTKSENSIRIRAIQGEQEISLNFQKIKSENNVKYELSAAQGTNELFDLNLNLEGLNTDSATETSELKFEYDLEGLGTSKTKFDYKYNIVKSFGTEFEKVKTESDVLLLNNAPNAETIQKLYTQIQTRFNQVNSEKMKAAGLNNVDNPFIYYIPVAIPSGLNISTNNNSTMVNDTEREKISLMTMQVVTDIYADMYGNNKTRKSEKVTKKDLEKGLKDNNINATVAENKDKTFTITVTETKNKYNINEKGKLISYEYINK